MFRVETFGERTICIGGIGKMFAQEGYPISISVSSFIEKNIEVSFYHIINELWDLGWSWKTIEAKFKGELQDDIDNSLNIDFEKLKYFYDCLEQPKRANGGYEESRSIIFDFLFKGNMEISKDKLRKIIS